MWCRLQTRIRLWAAQLHSSQACLISCTCTTQLWWQCWGVSGDYCYSESKRRRRQRAADCMSALFAPGTVIIGRQFSQLRVIRPDQTRAQSSALSQLQRPTTIMTTATTSGDYVLFKMSSSFPAAAAAMTSRHNSYYVTRYAWLHTTQASSIINSSYFI